MDSNDSGKRDHVPGRYLADADSVHGLASVHGASSDERQTTTAAAAAQLVGNGTTTANQSCAFFQHGERRAARFAGVEDSAAFPSRHDLL